MNKTEALSQLLLSNFDLFVRYFWPKLGGPTKLPPYIQDIIKCVTTKAKVRVINVPPNHGKSTIISHLLPAYLWACDPTLKIWLVSYDSTISYKNLDTVRSIINSSEYKMLFPHVILSSTQDTKRFVKTMSNGELFATVPGSTATGFHYHIAIIDDPHKADDHNKVGNLNKTNDWYFTTFATRHQQGNWSTPISDGATQIIVGQRLSSLDLHAKVIAANKRTRDFIHLKLPIIMNGKPLRSDVSLSDLMKKQMGMDPSIWEAQFNQAPLTLSSQNYVHRRHFPMVDDSLKDLVNKAHIRNIFISVDANATKARLNDCTAIIVGLSMVLDGKSVMVIVDIVNRNMDFREQMDEICSLANKWDRTLKALNCLILNKQIIVENKSNGAAILAQLPIELDTHFKWSCHPVNPTKSKIDRTLDAIPIIHKGEVLIHHSIPSSVIEPFIEQWSTFPNSSKDDMIDSLSQALSLFSVSSKISSKQRALSNW